MSIRISMYVCYHKEMSTVHAIIKLTYLYLPLYVETHDTIININFQVAFAIHINFTNTFVTITELGHVNKQVHNRLTVN